MQVDLNLTQNGTTNGLTQNGTSGEKPTNGVAEQANGVPKRKLAEENEDMPEKKLKLEDLKKNDVQKTEDVKMEFEEVKEENIPNLITGEVQTICSRDTFSIIRSLIFFRCIKFYSWSRALSLFCNWCHSAI